MQRYDLQHLKVRIPVPVFGIGCGVLGMSTSKVTIEFGKWASILLRALEYRGYDSTGAVLSS